MSQVIAEFLAKITADTTGLQKGLGQTKSQVSGLKGTLQELGLGTAASFLTVTGAVVGVTAAIKGTMDATIAYGDNIERVKRLTGQSAEESSRLIQVSDDLFVSQEALNQALTIAGKKYDVSINGIADLADQYNALETTTEKNAFAAEHFGRNYTEVIKLLEAGGSKIKTLAANQPEGLIFDESDLASIKLYKQQMDQLGDTFEALKMSAGKDVLPFTARVLGELNSNIEESGTAVGILRFGFDDLWRAITGGGEAAADEADAIGDVGEASEDTSSSLDALAQSQKDAEETAKRLSNVYTGMVSSMFAIQSGSEQYAETLEQLTKSDEDLENQKKRLTLEFWNEKAASDGTVASYSEYIAKMSEVDQALDDNAKKREQAATDLKKQGDQRIFDMVQQRLAADGLIDSGEFEYLQQIAVQKGLVSKAAADQAITESRAADQIVGGFIGTTVAMDATIERMYAIRALSGVVQFGVNFQSNVPGAGPGGNTFGTNGINYSQSFGNGQGSPFFVPMASRDSGGPGMPGQSYYIGTGAQPELFQPSVNGNFTPAKDLGKTVNVSISVGSVRSNQDLDYLAQEVARRVTAV